MTDQFVFTNNAQGTLAAGISATAVTITLSPGEGALFPNPTSGQQFAVTFIPASTGVPGEIAYCTAKSGDTLTVVRGEEAALGGQGATDYLAGDTVAHDLTAGQMAAFEQGGAPVEGEIVYNASGFYTFTVPSPTFTVDVTGGGGGSSASIGTTAPPCGGAGSHTRKVFTGQTVGATIAVTVGVGGSQGIYDFSMVDIAGGNGGTSSFGSFMSATGGEGGGQEALYEGGLGGTSTGGDYNDRGGDGAGGDTTPSTVGMGTGGASYYGGGGRMGSGFAEPGRAAGSGAGSPTSVTGLNGAFGQDGRVVIKWPI